MPIELSQHPEYAVKAAKYNADKSAASTAGDTAALSQAESEWAQARANMQMDLYNRAESELTRQARINEIKAAHPQVPDKVYEGITDLDTMLHVAESFQELAASRPQQAQGTWSPPSGTSGQTAGAELRYEDMTPDQREEARIKRMDDIAPNVMKRGALAREENEELQRLSLTPLTERFKV
jgi:hypothetical protein